MRDHARQGGVPLMVWATRTMSLVRWVLVCVVLTLSATAPAYGDSRGAPLSVTWHLGRLDVDVDGVPFRELLATIASKTGVEVRGLVNVEGNASIHFADRTLRDGLAALLTHFNYAMFDEPAARSREEHIVVIVVGHRSGLDAGTPVARQRVIEQEPSGSGIVYGPDAYQAVQHLVEQGDLRALREAASFSDPTTRALAMQRLVRLDPDEARHVATNAARSEDATQRVVALQVLGGLDSVEAASALGAALTDSEPSVRHAAVVGLMGQRSPAVTHFLEEALHDNAEPIRLLAMDLLARRSVTGMPVGNQ